MDDIVQRITNFIFSGDDVCLCDHCVLLDDAKDEIERLQKLVRSLRLDLIACHGELMGAYDEEARRG